MPPLAREIYRRMVAKKSTQKRLAIAAQLSDTYLRDLFDGRKQSVTVDKLQRIAEELDCTVGELLGEKPTITEDTRALVFRLTLEFLKVFRDGEQPVPPDASDYDLEIIAKAFADGALQQKAPDPDKLRQTVKHAIEEVNDLQSLRGR